MHRRSNLVDTFAGLTLAGSTLLASSHLVQYMMLLVLCGSLLLQVLNLPRGAEDTIQTPVSAALTAVVF